MLRLSKMTDYGIMVMGHMARHPDTALTASEVAAEVGLSAPTVQKILKTLARQGYLGSQRGAKGGYYLMLPAHDISLTDLIEALEGPLALTECGQGAGICAQEQSCTTRNHWRHINQTIRHTLSGITLAQLNGSARQLASHIVATDKVRPR